MSTRTASWIATIVLAVTLPLHTLAAWLGATRPPLEGVLDFSGFDLLWAGSFVAFEVVGAVIVTKKPAHPIGWLFLAAGAVNVVSTMSYEYAARALLVGIPLPGGEVAAWLSAWTWPPGLTLIVVAVLLFPTGRPPSPRWWPVAWIAVGVPALVAVAHAIDLWGLRGPTLLQNPELLYEGIAGDLWSLRLMTVAFPIFLASAVAAMIGLVVRYRRSRGVERQQLKVLALLAAVAAVALAASETVATSGLPNQIMEVMTAPGWFAVAAGFAILRYRLFDIDRVISRTVSYAVLTALLAGVYVTSVVGLGAVVRAATGGGGGDLVVAASTLAVAALFHPLRRRVQTLFDRRFNRSRYDATRLVEAFAQRLRDEVDLDVLVVDVRDVASSAVQPARASVWLATERER
jgi:hypothetical protein